MGNHAKQSPSARATPPAGSIAATAAYGLGDAGFLMVWQGAALFLLFFYVEIAGLPAMAAGAIFIAGMVWDAFTDPIFAAFAERRAARGQSYARLIAGAAPLVGLSYAALFFLPDGPIWVGVTIALAATLAFRSAFTLASMAYNALPARMTLDASRRSRLAAARVVGAACGGLAVAVATPQLVAMPDMQADGYVLAGALLGAAATACLWVCAAFAREAPDAPPLDKARKSYRAELAQVWTLARSSAPLRTLLIVMVSATLGFATFTGALLFYIESRPELAGQASLFLAAPTLASLVSAFVWAGFGSIVSKRAALCAGAALASLAFAGLSFVDGPAATLAALIMAGAGLSAVPVMLWSMAADTVDLGHFETGARVEARVFGLFTFLQKAATGLAALIVSAGIAAAGAADATGFHLTALISVAPCIFLALTALVALRYDLNAATHAQITRALAERRKGPAR